MSQVPMLYKAPFGDRWYLATKYKDLGSGKFEALSRVDVTDTLGSLIDDMKQRFLRVIGDDEESRWGHGEATYGDTHYDSATVYFGRNELREEIRQKVEQL